jgi:predicted nuclease of predicted toxin-antitoxin system
VKFKLDENFGTRTQQIFAQFGHDVHTVRQESLQGTSDRHLYEICKIEKRCLVTLDLDFTDVINFPPQQTGGIVVIRVPRNPTLKLLERLIRQLLQTVEQEPFEGNLWIVEVGRIRIHQDDHN